MLMIVVSAWMSETTVAGKSALHLMSVTSNSPFTGNHKSLCSFLVIYSSCILAKASSFRLNNNLFLHTVSNLLWKIITDYAYRQISNILLTSESNRPKRVINTISMSVKQLRNCMVRISKILIFECISWKSY